MKVADIHAHIFPEKLADKAPASISAFYGGMDVACHPATAENLVKFEHEAGITRFVMSNSATSAHQVRSINDFLPQAVKDVPGAIAFGSIFPGMDGAEEELERAKALGIRGLKVHPDFQKVPIDEPCGVPVYRKAAELGLPVLFHMGDNRYDYSTPERLLNLLRQVPDLQVIAAHFTPLSAYAFLVFILLYVPCVAALAAAKRELRSTKYFIMTICIQLGVAYVVTLLVYQIGRLFVA